jgi:D-alanyl-D-alanine dipeptidase
MAPVKPNAEPNQSTQTQLPSGFVFLDDIDPSILVDLRYAGSHNFVGRPIPGYRGKRAIMTRQAAEALRQVQALARGFKMTLKVYEAYRPQKATAAFVAWSQDLNDQKMKAEFYPGLDKAKIFPEGYVSPRSGHTRGSTVDLTLVALPVVADEPYVDGQTLRATTAPYLERWRDNSIDMGTGFDAFDALGNTADPRISAEAQANRKLLLAIMDQGGFDNYPKEWWHFTLRQEPFPETYFDFDY